MTEQMRVNEIGLSDTAADEVCELLTRDLADLHVLYTRTRNYHWNVTGPHFRSLHELFEEQYTAIAAEIDEVAERIRQLDRPAMGTMQEFCQVARLQEQPRHHPDAITMVTELAADHAQIIRQLRDDVEAAEQRHDQGTADFLTGLMQAHEKMAWMLRAFLER